MPNMIKQKVQNYDLKTCHESTLCASLFIGNDENIQCKSSFTAVPSARAVAEPDKP